MATLAAASAGLLLLALVAAAEADTNAADVAALGNLYTSWNSPAQLTGWSAGCGDPCGAAWTGVSCSGSAVISIKLSSMGLNGTLGCKLFSLLSLKTMDLSDNNLHDSIPYQLPSNLTYLNLARNNFSGKLPYSISNMVSLEYLNLSHNSLFHEIGELFGNLKSLSELDVSFNNLTGNLPISMGCLSKLSRLYMQNNQLSGTVNGLSNLSLATLNIAHNNFSGMIPQEFSSIPNLIVGGNSFVNMPASPPPTFTPPENPHNEPNYPQGPRSAPTCPETPIHQDNKKQGLQTGPLVGIVVGSIAAASCVLSVLVFFLHNAWKRNDEPKDKSLPSQTSTPAAESPTPAAESPTPAAESDSDTSTRVPVTLAAESPTPAAESPTPVAESPTPAAESPTPAAESPTPVAESSTPAAESPTPVAESPTPAAESPTPATESDSDTSTRVPVTLVNIERGPSEARRRSSSSRNFTGTGRFLSGGTVQPDAPQPPEDIVHNIYFWRNGFTVNDGPLRSFDDPANASFLESIKNSECPIELEPADGNSKVNVNLVQMEEECPQEPVERAAPFQGDRRTLVAPSDNTSNAAASPTATAPRRTITVDDSLPSTSLQIWFADGSRLVARFNTSHTISDVRSFIDATRPEASDYTL
ncbi:protein STRUBBELIG-RECEPTOR FAMILY 2-like [Phragmites australis]|uniref:protein STRUBBELIG-RECEPTOR FAMILY 2-like n=1 Tax=Phragmites australis TaxID=29695 RepID=UPI002D76E503|nr:protein STRUBBELIG-RECEPTOR FAMILY 2-like [Phragmites australis]